MARIAVRGVAEGKIGHDRPRFRAVLPGTRLTFRTANDNHPLRVIGDLSPLIAEVDAVIARVKERLKMRPLPGQEN